MNKQIVFFSVVLISHILSGMGGWKVYKSVAEWYNEHNGIRSLCILHLVISHYRYPASSSPAAEAIADADWMKWCGNLLSD